MLSLLSVHRRPVLPSLTVSWVLPQAQEALPVSPPTRHRYTAQLQLTDGRIRWLPTPSLGSGAIASCSHVGRGEGMFTRGHNMKASPLSYEGAKGVPSYLEDSIQPP